ncbi:MAG: hypothetical protein ACPGJE_04120 [Wenzhouxiangellaceae bacterium]
MRTTLTIDDALAEALKKTAFETGKSFKQVVNEALRAGLERHQALPGARTYSVKPADLGPAAASVNLDKTMRLVGELEDAERLGKMEQGR